MVDERIAGEVTAVPGRATPEREEALAKAYQQTPNIQSGAGQVAGPAMLAGLPDVSSMSPEQAAQEHARCMSDPKFMAGLSGSKMKMDHLEAISAARFGGGAAAGQKPAGAPLVGEDGQPLSLEQQRAHEALAAHEAELADPKELAALDEASKPRSVNEYNLNLPGGRAGSEGTQAELAGIKTAAFEMGVNPGVANDLWNNFGAYARMSDAQYDAAVDQAIGIISKRADGRKIIADAKQFVDAMPDNHPLAGAVGIAMMRASGIAELARLSRTTAARH